MMVCSNRHHSNMMTFRRGSVSTDDPVSFNCCDDAALGEGARYNKIEDLAGAKCLLSEERDEDLNQWCS